MHSDSLGLKAFCVLSLSLVLGFAAVAEDTSPATAENEAQKEAASSSRPEHAAAVQHAAGAAGGYKKEEPVLASQKPVKLYGRIEELTATAGAKIPLKMQAMKPIRDASLDTKTTSLEGKTSTLSTNLQSYPIDYRGSWTGEMTINSVNFDPSYFQFDRAAAEKEARLMKPGLRGRCTVTFFQDSSNKIQAEPTQVLFSGTDSYADQLKVMGGAGALNSMLGGSGSLANNPMLANMQVPVTYSLHLGAPVQAYERGVTGNQLSKELMKNTLKELARGVLEQEVVTKDEDRQTDTGRVQTGYSESVLRFTRISQSQLYLQAAYVYYRNDGKFQAKYMLYGTLNRSYSQPAAHPYGTPYGAQVSPYGGTSPYAGQPNPFGGMMPGMGGGNGNLQQQMQQMQKLIQQMGGR